MRPTPFVPGEIWLTSYPIAYAGVRFDARTSYVRLADGRLMIHSPGPIDDALAGEIRNLGDVAFIVAPGNFHHLHVAACQRWFPDAKTWICPGVETRNPALRYDAVLGDAPEADWAEDVDQVEVSGRVMREVAMFHRRTRTLLLVDLIERFTARTEGTNWALRAYFRLFRMWGRPSPAPEYWLAWGDRAAVRASLERILAWDFERIVLSHGDLVEHDAKDVAREAWRGILGR